MTKRRISISVHFNYNDFESILNIDHTVASSLFRILSNSCAASLKSNYVLIRTSSSVNSNFGVHLTYERSLTTTPSSLSSDSISFYYSSLVNPD